MGYLTFGYAVTLLATAVPDGGIISNLLTISIAFFTLSVNGLKLG
jgi:hypothetical protein